MITNYSLPRHAAFNLFAATNHVRWYTPPTTKTWSKQHFKFRIHRPLTDRFDAYHLHPECEWWRTRTDTPHDSFMGFPDVTKIPLRMGNGFIDHMDPMTLALVLDKCVREQCRDQNVLHRITNRAKSLVNQTEEPNLGFIYRAHAQLNWVADDMIRSYLGRVERRLPFCHICDVGPVLEAMRHPRFRDDRILVQLLEHSGMLLTHRKDIAPRDLVSLSVGLLVLHERSTEIFHVLRLLTLRLIDSYQKLRPNELVNALDCLRSLCPRNSIRVLYGLSKHLATRKLKSLTPSSCVRLSDCYFTALSLRNRNSIPSSSSSSSGTTSEKTNHENHGLEHLGFGDLSDCFEWPPYENQPALDNHSIKESPHGIVGGTGDDDIAFKLLERLHQTSQSLSTSEVLRALKAVNRDYLTSDRSRSAYAEFRRTMIHQWNRSLALDLIDIQPIDVARGLEGLARASEMELLFATVVPQLQQVIGSYPLEAVVEILKGSALPLLWLSTEQEGKTEQKKSLMHLIHATVARCDMLSANRVNLDAEQAMAILTSFKQGRILDQFPHFVVSLLTTIVLDRSLNDNAISSILSKCTLDVIPILMRISSSKSLHPTLSKEMNK